MIEFRLPLADRYVREHPDFFFDVSARRIEKGSTPRER